MVIVQAKYAFIMPSRYPVEEEYVAHPVKGQIVVPLSIQDEWRQTVDNINRE